MRRPTPARDVGGRPRLQAVEIIGSALGMDAALKTKRLSPFSTVQP